MTFGINLDSHLLRLSRKGDWLTPRHSFSGTHYWGLPGGGKTTSAMMQAGAYLRAGYGGYVTAVKSDEIEQWIAYARRHGRSNSVFVFDDSQGFNFMDYQLARDGVDGINTIVEGLMHVVDASRMIGANGGGHGGDAFWQDAPRMPLRYTLPTIFSAKGSVTIPDALRFIATAPTTPQEVTNPDWQKRSFMYEMMDRAARCPKIPLSKAALKNTINYWSEQWPSIPDKTRGNIVITLTTALDRFNHGRLHRVFCQNTTIVPELSFGGGVIIDAKPTLTWNEDGIIAQRLFKFFWQRAVLSRNSLEEKHRERPLFQWSDEAQETVLPTDGDFLGLCRQSKCAVTWLSQSLPTYFSRIGGDNPRDAALALAGKFGNHVFCTNSCNETNEFASRMIGKVLTRRRNVSIGSSESLNEGMSAGNSENTGTSSNVGSSSGGNYSVNHSTGSNSGTGTNWGDSRGRGTSENFSRGYSESMEYAIEPGDFARYLKSGGPQNNNRVTAVWFRAGHRFKATGTNYLIAEFKQ